MLSYSGTNPKERTAMRHDIDSEEELGPLFDHGGLVPTVCWALLLAAAGLSTLMDPGTPTGPRFEPVVTTTAQAAPQPR